LPKNAEKERVSVYFMSNIGANAPQKIDELFFRIMEELKNRLEKQRVLE
jgi:hypothetical protein